MQRLKFLTIYSVVSLLFVEYSSAMQTLNQKTEANSSICTQIGTIHPETSRIDNTSDDQSTKSLTNLIVDISGTSPVIKTIYNDKLKFANLIEQNKDVNLKYNNTPIIIVAADRGYWEIVDYLIEHGANIHSKDNEGRTVLFYAVKNEYKEVVSYLVEHGANIHSKDNEGRTVLFYAVKNEYKGIISYLVEQGAYISKEIFSLAYETNQFDVINYLIKKEIYYPECGFYRWNNISTNVDLSTVKCLNASNYKLNAFPEYYEKLVNLRYLNLSNNELKSVPEFVQYLTNLEFIDLRNNKLNFDFEIIKNLENLVAKYSDNEHKIINDLKNLISTYSIETSLKKLLKLPKLKEIKVDRSLVQNNPFVKSLKDDSKVKISTEDDITSNSVDRKQNLEDTDQSVDNKQDLEDTEQNIQTKNQQYINYVPNLYDYAQEKGIKSLEFQFQQNNNGLFNCKIKIFNKTFDYELYCTSKKLAKCEASKYIYEYLTENKEHFNILDEYLQNNKNSHNLSFKFKQNESNLFKCIATLDNKIFDQNVFYNSQTEAKNQISNIVYEYLTENIEHFHILDEYLQNNKNSHDLSFKFKQNESNLFKCIATLDNKSFDKNVFYNSQTEAENQISKVVYKYLKEKDKKVENNQDIDNVSTISQHGSYI